MKKYPFGFWTYVFSRIQRWYLKRQGYETITTTNSTKHL